ncbi:hypothetical protein HMPREF1355_02578, partial [Enterococcus faecium 515]
FPPTQNIIEPSFSQLTKKYLTLMVWWLFHSLNPCYTDSVVVVDKGCEKAILH